jgi:hypothetical protein
MQDPEEFAIGPVPRPGATAALFAAVQTLICPQAEHGGTLARMGDGRHATRL